MIVGLGGFVDKREKGLETEANCKRWPDVKLTRMRNNLYLPLSFCTAEVEQDSQELNNGQWYSKRR